MHSFSTRTVLMAAAQAKDSKYSLRYFTYDTETTFQFVTAGGPEKLIVVEGRDQKEPHPWPGDVRESQSLSLSFYVSLSPSLPILVSETRVIAYDLM
jgi:hypothetical protein